MIIEKFNNAWEKERKKVEQNLNEILDREIQSMRSSIEAEKSSDSEYSLELKKNMSALITKKALSLYESENIVLHRLQVRTSYIAVVISSIALVISILAILFK